MLLLVVVKDYKQYREWCQEMGVYPPGPLAQYVTEYQRIMSIKRWEPRGDVQLVVIEFPEGQAGEELKGMLTAKGYLE